MFSDKTYKAVLKDVLAEGEKLGVDIRQGSIFYDAVSGACFKIAQYYADLSTSLELVFLATAVGDYLDLKGEEFNLPRNQATKARYKYAYSGTRPQAGDRFFYNSKYFVLQESSDGLYLEAETAGSECNDIPESSAAVPVRNISGLTASGFGEEIEPGADREGDDRYRQRIREKIAGPAQNGNRQHYKTWCESIDGTGRARILPLFAGENTVLGVIYADDGSPAADALVEKVQEYIDPADKGLEVEYKGKTVRIGDGLGNGVANIGAHFAAVPAEALHLRIEFTAAFSRDTSIETLTAAAEEAITEHFKDIALKTPENEKMVIRLAAVGNIIYGIPAVVDYTSLTIQGGTENIELEDTQAPVLEEVIVHAAL